MLTAHTTTDPAEKIEAQKAWEAYKQPATGGRQQADTAAMNAYYDAIQSGKSKKEAEKVFFDTYKKV